MSSNSDNDSYDSDDSDDGSDSSDIGGYNSRYIIREGQLHLVGDNLPDKYSLFVKTAADSICELWPDENWKTLGREIQGNEHLLSVYFTLSMKIIIDRPYDTDTDTGVLSDENMISIFKGLTRSNTIRSMYLPRNRFGVSGVQAMVPFLMNSSKLVELDLGHNNIQSEGFHAVYRALRGSPINLLHCGWCGVENLDLDGDYIPKRLQHLGLSGNNINSEGCRELTKLLLSEDCILKTLGLRENNIDDEGVAILVDALRMNTSLKVITLDENERITMKGKASMLKLVNDISSIDATLQSNHTLTTFGKSFEQEGESFINTPDRLIRHRISKALHTNCNMTSWTRMTSSQLDTAGRKKVISTQLNSRERALLCDLQDVDVCNEALYSEINPLHLPEVLAMIYQHHGQSELYVALVSSIAGLLSTINRKKILQERVEHHLSIIKEHAATVETLRTEIAAIEEAEGNIAETENDFKSLGCKRRRA